MPRSGVRYGAPTGAETLSSISRRLGVRGTRGRRFAVPARAAASPIGRMFR
jgi:hypothetical protein